MAKRKTNKTQEAYKLFSKMSKKRADEYRSKLEEEMEEINEKISNKDKELEGRQSVIDTTTDPNKKAILIAQRETADAEKADLVAMRNRKQKEINLMENWKKNKDKIEKIIDYKKKLNSRLKNTKIELKIKKREIKDLETESKDIDKKLEKSTELANEEYNNLTTRKEQIEKEVEARKKAIAELEKREETLTGSIGKCDLVWENLMLGKSWDEIHVKAVQMKAKKVPAPTKGDPTQTNDPGKGGTGKGSDDPKGPEGAASNFKSLLDKWKEKRGSDTAPTQPMPKVGGQQGDDTEAMTKYNEFRAKHPRLAKMWDKIRSVFKRKEEQQQQSPGTLRGEKTRDAFVEQLRQMVEEDYKTEVRGAKEKDYIVSHYSKEYIAKQEEKAAKRAAKNQNAKGGDSR